MSTDRILVVGATGMLGLPVARALRAAGWRVRCLVRDEHRARALLGGDFEYAVADVTLPATLENAFAECRHVHLNLRGGNTVESYERQEVQGAAHCAAAAKRCGARRISYLSGSGRTDAEVQRHFPVRIKLAVETALATSGVPWTVFRATHFMESLPQFVRKGRATVLGQQPHRLHYLAADDYAGMVCRALQTPLAENRALNLWGPEAWTMREALERYVAKLHPDLRVGMLPLPIARALAFVTRDPDLRFAAQLFAAFTAIGESGDPTAANQLLGSPTTTLEHWLSGGRPLARMLLAVRDGAPLLDGLPQALRPVDVSSAYEVADELVAALILRHGPVTGYKVGATSTQGQALLGLREPFYGRTFVKAILPSGSTWRDHGRAATVEAETGFILGVDLPPRRAAGAEAYSYAEVAAAVARTVPLFEINRPAFTKPFEIGGEWLIADNGVTQSFVIGAPAGEATTHLPDETVRVEKNGALCAEGAAHRVLGDPLRALHWLANALTRQGRGLKRGDVVASGAMTAPIPLNDGDHLVARYATLGSVELRVSGSYG